RRRARIHRRDHRAQAHSEKTDHGPSHARYQAGQQSAEKARQHSAVRRNTRSTRNSIRFLVLLVFLPLLFPPYRSNDVADFVRSFVNPSEGYCSAQLKPSYRVQSGGRDATALRTIGITSKLAGSHTCLEVGGDRSRSLGEDTIGR